MTDVLPYDGMLSLIIQAFPPRYSCSHPAGLSHPQIASHREEPKSAEHVEDVGLVRANHEEKQQLPTPPKTPAIHSDQKKPMKDGLLTDRSPVAAKEMVDDIDKENKKNVEVTEKPRLEREDQIEDDVGKAPTPEPEGKVKDMKEGAESPEILLKRMQERMSFIEKQLKDSGILTRSDDESSINERGSKTDLDKMKSRLKRQPAIPKLQYVEWEDFKHKYANEEEVCAVEVLVGEARYYHQREEDMKNIRMGRGTIPKVQAEAAEKKNEPPSMSLKSSKELPERIRINSKPILTILGEIDSEDEWGKS